MTSDLSYPIGKHTRPTSNTPAERAQRIAGLAALPANLRAAVKGLSDAQLDTPYRPGGWTVRQTVHHIADSHLNSFVRFKLALTEEVPTIRPYAEDRWAELADSRLPVEVSLSLLESLHERWTVLLEAMTDEDFERRLLHPDSGEWTLAKMLGLYDWHSRHHTAHITRLRERNGW